MPSPVTIPAVDAHYRYSAEFRFGLQVVGVETYVAPAYRVEEGYSSNLPYYFSLLGTSIIGYGETTLQNGLCELTFTSEHDQDGDLTLTARWSGGESYIPSDPSADGWYANQGAEVHWELGGNTIHRFLQNWPPAAPPAPPYYQGQTPAGLLGPAVDASYHEHRIEIVRWIADPSTWIAPGTTLWGITYSAWVPNVREWLRWLVDGEVVYSAEVGSSDMWAIDPDEYVVWNPVSLTSEGGPSRRTTFDGTAPTISCQLYLRGSGDAQHVLYPPLDTRYVPERPATSALLADVCVTVNGIIRLQDTCRDGVCEWKDGYIGTPELGAHRTIGETGAGLYLDNLSWASFPRYPDPTWGGDWPDHLWGAYPYSPPGVTSIAYHDGLRRWYSRTATAVSGAEVRNDLTGGAAPSSSAGWPGFSNTIAATYPHYVSGLAQPTHAGIHGLAAFDLTLAALRHSDGATGFPAAYASEVAGPFPVEYIPGFEFGIFNYLLAEPPAGRHGVLTTASTEPRWGVVMGYYAVGNFGPIHGDSVTWDPELPASMLEVSPAGQVLNPQGQVVYSWPAQLINPWRRFGYSYANANDNTAYPTLAINDDVLRFWVEVGRDADPGFGFDHGTHFRFGDPAIGEDRKLAAMQADDVIGVLDPVSGEPILIGLSEEWQAFGEGKAPVGELDLFTNVLRRQAIPSERFDSWTAAGMHGQPPVQNVATLPNLTSFQAGYALADAAFLPTGVLYVAVWRIWWNGDLELLLYRQQDETQDAELLVTYVVDDRPPGLRCYLVTDPVSAEVWLVLPAGQGAALVSIEPDGTLNEATVTASSETPVPPYGAYVTDPDWWWLDAFVAPDGTPRARLVYSSWFDRIPTAPADVIATYLSNVGYTASYQAGSELWYYRVADMRPMRSELDWQLAGSSWVEQDAEELVA